MATTSAIEMAIEAGISPKRFRQALRKHWRQGNRDLSWHIRNERWTVQVGSDRHLAMAHVLLLIRSQESTFIKSGEERVGKRNGSSF